MRLDSWLRSRRRSLGSDHPDSLETVRLLSTLIADQGDLDAARSLMEEPLEAHRRVLGVDAPETDEAPRHLARLVYDKGDDEGLNALLGSKAIRRTGPGSSKPVTSPAPAAN